MDCFLTLQYRQDVHAGLADVTYRYRVVSYYCPLLDRNSDRQGTGMVEIDVTSLPDRNLLQWTADPYCFAFGCIYYGGMKDMPAIVFDDGRCIALHVQYRASAVKGMENILKLKVRAEITACGKMKF